MAVRTADVLDVAKVDSAIEGVFGVFDSEELTVAEAIQVAISVCAALEGKYPEAYRIMMHKPDIPDEQE